MDGATLTIMLQYQHRRFFSGVWVVFNNDCRSYALQHIFCQNIISNQFAEAVL